MGDEGALAAAEESAVVGICEVVVELNGVWADGRGEMTCWVEGEERR